MKLSTTLFALVLSFNVVFASGHLYLRDDSIPGDAQAKDFVKQHDIDSFHLSISRNCEENLQERKECSNPQFSEATVSFGVNPALSAFYEEATSGEPRHTITVIATRTDGAPYLRYEFTEAMYTSVTSTLNEDGMQNVLTFQFGTITVTPILNDEAGNTKEGTPFTFNLQTMKKE